MILPFAALLGTIALAPLAFPHWWHRHYPKVAIGLGLVTLAYYGPVLREYGRILEVAYEYVSFIALIGSLFVVSGGIHIKVKGEATPLANAVFLLVGAVVANLLGTTGASMLLIRPWLRMNKYRITAHHIVFFIFLVSNVGGGLTPIGDPPLFLGYLKGVPFWWVLHHCWPMWLAGVGGLLAIFLALDYRNYWRAPKQVRDTVAGPADQWRFEGLGNLGFLFLILGAVFINEPVFLREAVMLGAALGSYFTTRRSVHEANDFNFEPIREVALLFIGIFATMIPALDYLQTHAGAMGRPTPAFFYWACGGLSSILDNAPTYLSFLSAIFGSVIDPEIVRRVQALIETAGAGRSAALIQRTPEILNTLQALQTYFGPQMKAHTVSLEQIEIAFLIGNTLFNNYLMAISVGSVFFGAMTYIGNGPNFMVKSIADQAKVHTPTFLGYLVRFALPVLLPVLALVWWLFFS